MSEVKKEHRIWSQPMQCSIHHINIFGPIEGPEEWQEELNLIRSAGPNDRVVIHLSTPGGNFETCCQFRAALLETEAETVASIEGSCHSSGSMIALSCQAVAVYDTALMLCHNYSGGDYGKGAELLQSVTEQNKWIANVMRAIYKHFLTEEEIEGLIKDKDIWLHPEDITMRWELRDLALEKEEELERKELEDRVHDQVQKLQKSNC